MPFLQEYTMLDELGRGGFATVYKVRHNELGYIRAIRVLNETIVDADSPTYRKFLRECKVLLRLGNGNHPNIVHIYQPRLLDNKALVEMDYVDGQDILHYLQQNQNFVPVEEVIRMALQMSSALAYCHEDIYRFCMDRNTDGLQDDPNDGSKVLIDEQTRKRLIEKYKVIHNDIHSGNIMRREDGNYVLLDFGLAIEGDEVVRSSRHANGAPEFKSPEKWDDESILCEQSDIYSFGIVMYEMLAGRVPFPFDKKNSNKTEAEYKLSVAHKKVSPPSIEKLRKEFFEKKYPGQEYRKDYPQWLEDVILKCLEKKPADRFKNGKELYNSVLAHSDKTEIGPYEPSGTASDKRKLKDWIWLLSMVIVVAACIFWVSSRDDVLQKEEDKSEEIIQIADSDTSNRQDNPKEKEVVAASSDKDEAIAIIKKFASARENDDLDAISQLYANNVRRFYRLDNIAKKDVVDDFRHYNENFGVLSKQIRIRWNTLQVQELPSGETAIDYVEDFHLNRVDKNKYSDFVLQMHIVINKDGEIVSIYDEQLSKSKGG